MSYTKKCKMRKNKVEEIIVNKIQIIENKVEEIIDNNVGDKIK